MWFQIRRADAKHWLIRWKPGGSKELTHLRLSSDWRRTVCATQLSRSRQGLSWRPLQANIEESAPTTREHVCIWLLPSSKLFGRLQVAKLWPMRLQRSKGKSTVHQLDVCRGSWGLHRAVTPRANESVTDKDLETRLTSTNPLLLRLLTPFRFLCCHLCLITTNNPSFSPTLLFQKWVFRERSLQVYLQWRKCLTQLHKHTFYRWLIATQAIHIHRVKLLWACWSGCLCTHINFYLH